MIKNNKLRSALMVSILILSTSSILCAQEKTTIQDSISNETKDITTHTIKSNDFNKGFIISPYELIQGRIPGLIISSYNGSPHGRYTIIRRGNNTVDNDSGPVIIIDGVQQYSNSLEINPKDIESISYQAQPSTNNLYFGPFLNGALIIKTKNSTKKLKLEFSTSYAISELPKKIDLFNAKELMEIRKEKFPRYIPYYDFQENIDTDWQDAIYRKAVGTDYYLAASGTIKKWLPFRVSVGKTSQEGILMTSKYDRTSYNMRFNPSLFDNHLNMDLSMRVNNNDGRTVNEQIYMMTIFANPNYPITGREYSSYNPYLFLRDTKETYTTKSRSLNAMINYKLHSLPDININLEYTKNKKDNKYKERYDRDAYWFAYLKNITEVNHTTEYDESLINASINYSKVLNNDNKIDVSIAYQKYEKDMSIYGKKTGAFEYSNIIKSSFKYNNQFENSNKLASLSYSYKNKYTAKLNHMITKKNYYYELSSSSTSLSFTWDLKKESQFINNKNISTLLLKASYNRNENPLNMTINTYLKEKEKYSSYNLALYYSYFNERLEGFLSYSHEINKPIEEMSYNEGHIMHIPYEISINTLLFKLKSKILNTNNIKWNVSTNISYSNNEVTESKYKVPVRDHVIKKGEARNTFYLHKQVYDENGKPVDGNNNTNKNISLSETSDPKCIVGLHSCLKIKNIDFSFSGRAYYGNYIYNSYAAESYYNQTLYHNTSKYVLDSNFDNDNGFSDYYVSNSSFFRMDYISLAYNFNNLFKKRVNINLAASVQNAFVLTAYEGEDPESTNGRDNLSYPRPRIYSLSLKISFK